MRCWICSVLCFVGLTILWTAAGEDATAPADNVTNSGRQLELDSPPPTEAAHTWQWDWTASVQSVLGEIKELKHALQNNLATNEYNNATLAASSPAGNGTTPGQQHNASDAGLPEPHLNCLLRPINWWNYTTGRARIITGAQFEAALGVPPAASGVGRWSRVASHSATRRQQSDGHTRARQSGSAARLKCTVVFIYARWCRYSMQAAATFNALARAFPQLEFVAIQVEHYWEFKWSLHMFYVPKIKVYAGRQIYREFNGSDSDLDQLINFVWRATHVRPHGDAAHGINEEDRQGPVPTQLQPARNHWLDIAWMLLLATMAYFLQGTRTAALMLRWGGLLLIPVRQILLLVWLWPGSRSRQRATVVGETHQRYSKQKISKT